MTVEVIVTGPGAHSRAEVPEGVEPEYVARVLWDDNRSGYQGSGKGLTGYVVVNGVTARIFERRP